MKSTPEALPVASRPTGRPATTGPHVRDWQNCGVAKRDDERLVRRERRRHRRLVERPVGRLRGRQRCEVDRPARERRGVRRRSRGRRPPALRSACGRRRRRAPGSCVPRPARRGASTSPASAPVDRRHVDVLRVGLGAARDADRLERRRRLARTASASGHARSRRGRSAARSAGTACRRRGTRRGSPRPEVGRPGHDRDVLTRSTPQRLERPRRRRCVVVVGRRVARRSSRSRLTTSTATGENEGSGESGASRRPA